MSDNWNMDPGKGGQTPPANPPAPLKNPPLSPLPPGAQMRDIPIVLPSLEVVTLRVPFPMSEEGYKTLVSSLATIKDALVQKKKLFQGGALRRSPPIFRNAIASQHPVTEFYAKSIASELDQLENRILRLRDALRLANS